MSKEKKSKSLSWDDFQSLGNPENAPEEIPEENGESGTKKSDKIRVYLERKGRGGKTVSIIKGLSLNPQDLEILATQIKNRCGTGGYLEESEIIIQGDQRNKIIAFMISEGYKDVKNAGH